MNHYVYGVEVPPCIREELRKVAAQIRGTLGLAYNECFPVACFIERVLPKIYDDFVLEILPRDQLGERHGETFPDKHLMRLREDVYIGMCEGSGQHRFAGAHECAHHIYHEGIPLAFFRSSAKNLPLFRNSEWQADTLAAELLMPYEAVKHMGVQDIKTKYGVSRSVAQCRRDKIDKEEMQYEYITI